MEDLIDIFNQLNIDEKKIVKSIQDDNIDLIINSLNNLKIDNLDNKKIDLAIELVKNYYNILSSKKRCVYFNNIKTPYFIY
jgi:hypothetical protein